MNGNAISRLLATICLALSGTLALAETDALLPTLMPECDVAIFARMEKMRSSQIVESFKAFENLGQRMGANAQWGDMEHMQAMLRDVTGLEDKDFIAFAGAVDLTGVDIASRRSPAWPEMDAVLAMELGKSLSDDQLERSLQAFARQLAEKEGLDTPPTVSRESHRGDALFYGASPDDPDERAYFAMAGGGKVFLLGSEKGVKGALDRWRDGARHRARQLFPATVGAPVLNNDFYMLFKPTGEMIAKMKADAGADSNQADGPAVMAQQALAQMTALAVGIDAGDTLKITLFGDFGSQPVAQQIKILLDNQVISGIRMFGTMMSGGKPLPMLQSLQANATANGAASLALVISQQDVKTFLEAIETRGQGGMMMPPDDI